MVAAKKIRKKQRRTLTATQQAPIVISDSDDSDGPELSAAEVTVVAQNDSSPLTPPPEVAMGGGDVDALLPFYESRTPNDGRDELPVYEETCAVPMMSLSLPLLDDSILERPASTPIINPSPSAFEYSLISDTSLQINATGNEDTVMFADQVVESIDLDSTLVGEDAHDETPVAVAKEEVARSVFCNESLEDGEILDVDNADDSVVFVCEEILTPQGKQKMARKLNMMQRLKEKAEMYRQNCKTPKTTPQKENLPHKEKPRNRRPTPPGRRRRMVIIDGSNVAFSHTENGRFSVRGLEICLEHFLSQGFEARAVVPQFRMKRTQTDNHTKMMELERKKLLIKTPAKDLAGQYAASYDDRFILNIAKEFDGAIVSNDHYRDLLTESQDFAAIIRSRVIGYTWVQDKLFIPSDPYGRIGPTLDEILFTDPEA